MEEYKLIDLGLPSGTLWMDRNIGARKITNYGWYSAWGDVNCYTADEVGEYKQFSWTDYKYCNGNKATLTKYCDASDYGNDGYTDSLVTLQTTDDAVYQFTDGKSQMPTKEQIEELLDNTNYEWTMMDRVNSGVFTSKVNGNSIFIPAVGFCNNGSVDGIGVVGSLWGSSLDEDSPGNAWLLGFGSGGVDCGNSSRYYGLPVRGIVRTVE